MTQSLSKVPFSLWVYQLLTLELYTCDLEIDKLEVDYRDVDKSKAKRPKVEAKNRRNKVLQLTMSDSKAWKNTYSILERDDDFIQMRQNFKKEFFDKWNIGL